jgi:hypothetical protein
MLYGKTRNHFYLSPTALSGLVVEEVADEESGDTCV